MAPLRGLAAGLCLAEVLHVAGAQAPALPENASDLTMMNISADELRNKISGFWLGQLVGNFMGLPFEFQYLYDTLPILPEKYYDRAMAEAEGLRVGPGGYGSIPQYLDRLQGSYTDDDTDIEFVTLAAIEEHGLDLKWPQIAKYWQKYVHIKVDGNDALWFANKVAREKMDEDLVPPSTGIPQNNVFWWTIDPQLVNELWSALYPGMVDKAVGRAEWGAKITSADWGTHPTIWYAALISAAFFETDVNKMYDMAMTYVPSGSPFLAGLEEVKELYVRHPNDWRRARKEIFSNYLRFPDDCGEDMWNCGVSAMINGLLGAIAFLWGEGDFKTTVGIGIAAGMDCDNQAATMGALMGAMHGESGIPRAWTHEIAGNNWSMPFNNRYVNERRQPLPKDNNITDIVENILKWTEKAILDNGGSKDGDVYQVMLSGMEGKPDATPAPPSTGSCCDWCEAGSYCSPGSGNCYSWKRKGYYHTCEAAASATASNVFYP